MIAPLVLLSLSVGDILVARSPDFDVAADEERKILHFVWRDNDQIKHVASRDLGRTWSAPGLAVAAGAAGGPRIALDKAGGIHMAYGTAKEGCPHGDGRTWYVARRAGAWGAPQEALLPRPTRDSHQVIGPRIAVDGRDNVHVIGWKIVHNPRWLKDMRCAYARKPSGAAAFEPTAELSHGRDGEGGGGHGDLATDASGDTHIIYVSYTSRGWSTNHLVRRAGGAWDAKVDVFPVGVATDFGMSAAVDTDGVIHIAGQDSSGWSDANSKAPIHWTYFNNKEDPSQLKAVHRIDDFWEFGSDLLLAPNHDVWMSRGHWQKDQPFPWAGRVVHLDAASGTWSAPVNLSPAGVRNADRKYGQVPKLVYLSGQVLVFYAEQAVPGGPFRYRQRRLSAAPRPRS